MHRIGLLGGECTGKSTLAAGLATALPAVVAPEYLREFVTAMGRVPSPDEQESIMRRQMAMVEDAEAEAEAGGIEWVVADPLPLMTALYSIVYFSDDSLWEVSMQDARRYDLILWCQPDVPWTPEPGMRDGELHRLAAHEVIAERAAVLLPLRLISGTADIRVAGALGYAAEIDAATRPGA